MYEYNYGLPYQAPYSNLGGRNFDDMRFNQYGLGAYRRPSRNQGAIQNALSRFDSAFQPVDLPQRAINNATDFGVLGSGLNNAINNSIGRFDSAFETSDSIFGRYY